MSPVHPELEGPLKRMSAVDPTKRIFRFLGAAGAHTDVHTEGLRRQC